MADPITAAITNPAVRRRNAVARLREDIDALQALAFDISGASEYAATAVKLFERAREMLRTGANDDGATAVIEAAKSVAAVGRNAFQVLAAESGLTSQAVAKLSGVAALYRDVYCLLATAYEAGTQRFDTAPLLGSSNCSSTGGGTASAPAPNVMELLFALNNAAGLRVSTVAAAQIAAWSVDPLSQPASAVAAVPQSLRQIAAGVVVP